jgi:hypothetical protein
MYYTIYTSDENEQFYLYNNIINKNFKKKHQDKLCIICWVKNEPDDELYYIKDFDQYIVSCNCNVLMHGNCLDQWILKTNSCPICRKQISGNYHYLQYDNTNYILIIKYYLIVYNNTIKILKFFSYLSVINFFCLIICSFYFQYILTYEIIKNRLFNL